jgi:hypothetical protein
MLPGRSPGYRRTVATACRRTTGRRSRTHRNTIRALVAASMNRLPNAYADCCTDRADSTRDRTRELLVLHARHVEVDVDAVHERAADALAIARDRPVAAAAGLHGIAVLPARAWIHGSDQHEVGGKRHRSARTGHRDLPVLKRLPEHLEHVMTELGNPPGEFCQPLEGQPRRRCARPRPQSRGQQWTAALAASMSV